ncbi:MAG TPA: hypothetical protein VIG50_13385 [Vicinamibacteria bacterium]
MTRRTLLTVLFGVLAVAGVGALCPPLATRPAPSATRPELDLASLSAQLSEPPGYFDTDNLISNESSYLQVADRLADEVPQDGVYIGVGPEQNFSYIARVRPRYAFILDIRRQNLLQHLLFAALFARADDARAYLCLLFSRPCAGPGPPQAWGGADAAFDALPPPSEAAYAANLRSVYGHVERWLRFALTAEDRAHIQKVYRAFFDDQDEIRFRSFGRRGWHHPSYRTLLRAKSPSGRFGSFLDAPDDYRRVRDLSRAGRIVPVTGGFAGPHALRAIGAWTRARGLAVSTFYASNVEFYLARDQAFERFAANLRELPLRPDSVLVRACFEYGRVHPAALPGSRSVTLLQRLPRFLELHRAGAYGSEWDVCTVDYLR